MLDLLVVMNPRRIPQCMAAIEQLPIDKLWLRDMSEAQIADWWPRIMDAADGYQRLIMVGDDSCPRWHALDTVLGLHEHQPDSAITGYSNLSAVDYRVNLTKSPLRGDPSPDAYDLYTLQDIQEHPHMLVRTWLTGLTLLCMDTGMWERFPFDVYGRDAGGFASDYHLSVRLDQAGLEMWAARDAFVWHVKERWNEGDQAPEKQLLVGKNDPALVLSREGRADSFVSLDF